MFRGYDTGDQTLARAFVLLLRAVDLHGLRVMLVLLQYRGLLALIMYEGNSGSSLARRNLGRKVLESKVSDSIASAIGYTYLHSQVHYAVSCPGLCLPLPQCCRSDLVVEVASVRVEGAGRGVRKSCSGIRG